jgi:thiol-disulfide isomerase/thioredoxin
LSVAAAALIVSGCSIGGGDDGAVGSAAGSQAQNDGFASGKGVPAALAENREQAGQILEGGTDALDAKLAEFEGQPVVVNQWASWCEPCRAEFPFFADAANVHQKDVAFIGIDMQDDRGAAEQFLADFPVPYPHIWDPDARVISSIGGGFVSPTTVFFDENHEIVQAFQGSYATRDQLDQAIEDNLLAGKTS